ncbi:PHD finger protein 7-like isoform X1 [Gallus gallus]|uniref:PHD finger protein 7-like isoform X1 n=1 Tax=Gallus gallus TaxID=9031 RepID=UPI001AE0F0C6|nr:PHD finger protein 7-like isoform X1 [Gallus gallus]
MMYARKRKLSDSQEPACVLCGRGDVDRNIFGRTFDQIWFWVHEFCLLFANISFDESSTQEGTVGIDSAALTCKVKQANQKQCCVCGERGAAITCAESGCERSFHLPCAKDGQCVTQFFGWQRSFCWEHRPRQTAVTAPARGTTCVLCRQTVGNVASYHTLVCPVCKHAWFHRACVQQQALNEGIACFRCPACQDNTLFCIEMSILGIRIPDRTPEREDNRASAVVLQRHGHCDAVICFCAGGRDQAEEEGPWQLIPCSSCGAQSTHRECSYSSIRTNKWDCDRCAGLGTASSTFAQLAALSAASQQGLEPSHSPQEPEDSCSGPTIQPASGPSHTSQLLELSCQTRHFGILQSSHSGCAQEASQAAGNKPDTEPLPAARSGPTFPEPDQKTSAQQANTISSCSEENSQHQQTGDTEDLEGFPASRQQGMAQAARGGPHAKPFLSGTSSATCPQPALRRLREPVPTVGAAPGMKTSWV